MLSNRKRTIFRTAPPPHPVHQWDIMGMDCCVDFRTGIFFRMALTSNLGFVIKRAANRALAGYAVKTKRKRATNFLFISLFVLFSSALASDRLLLKNARIFTMEERGILESGMILISEGKIEKIEPDIPVPSETQVLDLAGKTIIPGLVCASSALFLDERDLRYSGEESPDTDVLEGIHYLDPSVFQVQKYGVTTVYISPVSFRSIGGLGAVVKALSGESGNARVLKEKAALNIRLERLQDKKTSNVLRLSQYHAIRDRFIQAREYRKKWADYETQQKKYEEEQSRLDEKKETGTSDENKLKKPDKPGRDEASEILLLAMDKKIPVRFIVHRPDSILQALRLGKEFGLAVVLEGAEDWPGLLAELEEASVLLLSNPLMDYRMFLLPGGARGYAAGFLPVRESDLFYSDRASLRSTKPNPASWAKLAESEIPFALVPSDRFPLSAGFLRFYAALISSHGVPSGYALESVTSNAARILGVSDRVGSLAEGKDADLVVLDGDPLDSLAKIDLVLIDGETVWKRK